MKKMVLQSILDASHTAKIIILQEKREARATPFLSTFLRNSANKYGLNHCPRSQSLHLIGFQNPTEFYKNMIPQSANIFFYDVFTDPFGWNSSPRSSHSGQMICRVGDFFSQLVKNHNNSGQGKKGKTTVVFDGLSLLTRHTDIPFICKLLESFSNALYSNGNTQVLAVAERELLLDIDLKLLKFISNSYIELDLVDPAPGYPLTYTVDVTDRKDTGRVDREVGVYRFSSQFELRKVEDLDLGFLSRNEEEPEDQGDPAANLPFNLRLTDSERVARSQVKLPYMLDHNQKAAQLDGPSTGGQIIYRPDDADDFDEEDPDDDLDI